MKINIICFGKLNKNYQLLFDEYAKKIHNIEVNLVELKEIKTNNIEQKIIDETDLILQKIPKNSTVFVLAIQGKKLDSIQFSNILNQVNMTFIIGGSNGLNLSKFNKNQLISFSDLTFPHELFRIMLIEQIYRGFKIQSNSRYHK